jgi:hypothetical protein
MICCGVWSTAVTVVVQRSVLAITRSLKQPPVVCGLPRGLPLDQTLAGRC